MRYLVGLYTGIIICCQIRRQQRTITKSTQIKKRAENKKKTVETSLTFHLVLRLSLSNTTDPGRRFDLPSASLVSWPRLGPRFHLVHLGDCTLSPQVAWRKGKNIGQKEPRVDVPSSQTCHESRATLHATLIQNHTVLRYIYIYIL